MVLLKLKNKVHKITNFSQKFANNLIKNNLLSNLIKSQLKKNICKKYTILTNYEFFSIVYSKYF